VRNPTRGQRIHLCEIPSQIFPLPPRASPLKLPPKSDTSCLSRTLSSGEGQANATMAIFTPLHPMLSCFVLARVLAAQPPPAPWLVKSSGWGGDHSSEGRPPCWSLHSGHAQRKRMHSHPPSGSAKRSGDLHAMLRRPAPASAHPRGISSHPRMAARLRKGNRCCGHAFGLPCRGKVIFLQ